MKIFAGLFGIFAMLVVGAYFFSRHTYKTGQGLEQSTESQVLLQYQTVANAGLKIDVRPLLQAERVSYGAAATAKFEVSNLVNEAKRFRLRLEFFPAGNESAFRWTKPLELAQTLAAKEKKLLEFPFVLEKQQTTSTDGTLNFKLSLDPAP